MYNVGSGDIPLRAQRMRNVTLLALFTNALTSHLWHNPLYHLLPPALLCAGAKAVTNKRIVSQRLE